MTAGSLRVVFVRASLSLAVAAAALAAGCDSGTTSPSIDTVPYSQTDLRLGTGADAVSGSKVNVLYTGWLYDDTKPGQKGMQFDTTLGRTPFTFTLGAGQVIKGWDQGVLGMKVGGVRRLVIPPSLAYGTSGSAPLIPGYATLVFEIELLSIQ